MNAGKKEIRKDTLIFALFITEDCNMRCTYCFAAKRKKSMPLGLARKSVDFASGLDYRRVIITFLGGEPLLEYEKIKKIIAHSEAKGINRFNIATNGLLLDKDKLDYFHEHNVAVQFSFDGVKESQDMCRIKKEGNGSYGILKHKLRLFSEYSKKMHFEIRMTLSAKTIPFLYDSLKFVGSLGFNNSRINLMPVVSCAAWKEEDYIALKNQILKINGLIGEKKLDIHLNECLGEGSNVCSLFSEPSETCSAGARVLCADTSGDIYPCFVYAGVSNIKKSKYLLGNVRTSFNPGLGLDFAGRYESKYSSCPTWNYFLGERAVETYKRIFETWRGNITAKNG